MVKTICLNYRTQFCPILSTWDKDIFKELFDAIRFWYKFSSRVLIKVSTVGIVWFFKVVEGNAPFARDVVGFYESPVVHEHEVDAGELNRLRWSVFNQLLGKVAVKSHCSKSERMRQFISVVNSWNGHDMRAICNQGYMRRLFPFEQILGHRWSSLVLELEGSLNTSYSWWFFHQQGLPG